MNFKVQKKELSSLQGIYCVTFLQLALNLTVTICCVVYWRILTFPTEPLFDKIITGTIVSAATFFYWIVDIFYFMEKSKIVRVLEAVNHIEEYFIFVNDRSLLLITALNYGFG